MKSFTAGWVTVVAIVLAGGGVPSAGATSSGGPMIDFRTSINCPPGPSGECDLFHFSLTNTTSSPIDGITLQWKDGSIVQFASPEAPTACGTKGVAAGAYVCWPILLQPGATFNGTGQVSPGPIAQGSVLQTYWTPDNFATATGVDTPFLVSPDPQGAALVKLAYKWEKKASAKVRSKNPWSPVLSDLRQSSSLLRRARGLVSKFPVPSGDLTKALGANGLASRACRMHRRAVAVRQIRAESASAAAALSSLVAIERR
jgi:hypothetical protein